MRRQKRSPVWAVGSLGLVNGVLALTVGGRYFLPASVVLMLLFLVVVSLDELVLRRGRDM